MNYLSAAALAGLVLLGSSPLAAQAAVHTDLRARVVRRADGERRYLPDGRFLLLKVGPVATGASYLFMGYEDLPPGTAIPRHRHEVDEELLIVQRGRVQVVVATDTSEATAGDAVYLPPRTAIAVATIGRDTASVFFVFPRASVEQCFQFVGRSEGQTTAPVRSSADTAAAYRTCQMTYE